MFILKILDLSGFTQFLRLSGNGWIGYREGALYFRAWRARYENNVGGGPAHLSLFEADLRALIKRRFIPRGSCVNAIFPRRSFERIPAPVTHV